MFDKEDKSGPYGTLLTGNQLEALQICAAKSERTLEDFLRDALNAALAGSRVTPLDDARCKIRISYGVRDIEKPQAPALGHLVWVEFHAAAGAITILKQQSDPAKPLDWIWRPIDRYIGRENLTTLIQ